MSSFLKNFIRKTPQSQNSTSQPQPSKGGTRPDSSPSINARDPTGISSSSQRPKVTLPTDPFPYITHVPWPPANKQTPPKPVPTNPKTQSHTSLVSVTIPTSPCILPTQEQNTHLNEYKTHAIESQPSVVRNHPEILLPARPSVVASPALVPHLIDIPIDSGPAFDDDIFRRKSDPDSSKNTSNPRTSNQRGTSQQQSSIVPEDKLSNQQVITIPIGPLYRGQRTSSPSMYSESSSTYSYVSAPELEYGYDDPYRLSSPKSHRLTRKDSTTLPQDLIWHLFHGGNPRNRDDDDDRRSRHSSVGKRSVKSRRNSDGGASIHTARRSTKSNSRTDTYDSIRAPSKSRSIKSKYPRMSSTSVSSSHISSAVSPTPTTLVYGPRASVFPSPNEPMPTHALQNIQAYKENAILTPNFKLQFWDNKSTSQGTDKKHPSSSRDSGVDNPRNSSTQPLASALEKNQNRASFMDYLDSPSDMVTLPEVLVGYNPARNQRGSLTHAYANASQPSNLPTPVRKEAPLPPMPEPPPLPTKTRSRNDLSESNAATATTNQIGQQNQSSFPPVLPFPITHDKSQSDFLYPEIPTSDKSRIKRTKSSPSQPSSITTSASTLVRPPPSPSRPLPSRPPPAVPTDDVPVAGPSKPKPIETASILSSHSHSRSSRLSTVDQESWKTIQSDKTIKPISIPVLSSSSNDGVMKSGKETFNHFKDAVSIPSSSSSPPLPPLPPPPLTSQDNLDSSPRSEYSTEQNPIEEKVIHGEPENGFPLKSSSDATLQVSTTTNSPSTVQPPQQLTPDMASAPCSSTSPSSYSSMPVSSSNVTSVCSGDVQATRQDEATVEQREDSRRSAAVISQPEDTQVTVRNVSLSSSDETEKQTRGYGLSGRLEGDVDEEEKVEVLSSKDRGDDDVRGKVEEVEVKRSSEEERSPEVTVETWISVKSKVDVPGSGDDRKADTRRADSLDELPEKIEEDKQDQDLNCGTSPNEPRKSIHGSIPWNSSTGSIGSQRLKNGHYMNPSHSSSSFALEDGRSAGRKQAVSNAHVDGQITGMNLRPEMYPLPRSMSSVELPLPSEDQKGVSESNRLVDPRTSSPNAYRTRPFSPHESIRSFSSHNVEHKTNRSMGELSQAASGLSLSNQQQRPLSRNSSTFIAVSPRINRSSALPTVEGVSPTPVSSQSNKLNKATLPIGNKTGPLLNDATQVTRTRSGSEPHPSKFQHRSQGRLSTIQQSPIHHARPSALPLRHEKPIGSMSFPETPYEYTPMTTPGVNTISPPHARGPSSTSNRQRKTSRLGSDVSLRRPAGPRPPRNNASNTNNNSNSNNYNYINNNSNNNARNASSKFASPPNTARSFDVDSAFDGGVLPDFRPRPVEWRAYTMEAALWTFTSEQLQDIVGRAIRQSAVPSTVRLLTHNALEEIKPEIERLEILQQDVSIRYCANITRRRVILKSLKHHLMDPDWTKRSQLVQELNDTSYLADQLTRDLFHTMYRLQQLYRLTDVHNGSALAMALRKLNSSFVKQLDDTTQLTECLAQSEAEKEEAWATAERFEREAMELRDKLETMSIALANQEGNSSESSSRRASDRKPSVRASKASFRLSRARFSHASSSSSNAHYPFSSPPPVPPIPRYSHTANSRILSLNTDISSSGILSVHSGQSFGFSPTPEALALEKAQRELYDILGLPPRPRKSLPPRTRPVSEILSPVTAEGALSPLKQVDHPLRRNNSIPISPYIISENFRN